MLKVRNFISEGTREGKLYGMAEISVDSSSELSTSTNNYIFSDGSIAWEITTGTFYGLSGGQWYAQDGSGDNS